MTRRQSATTGSLSPPIARIHPGNRGLRVPGRVPRTRHPRAAGIHPGPRPPSPPRVGGIGARARQRAQGGDLGGRRPAGRGAAQAGGSANRRTRGAPGSGRAAPAPRGRPAGHEHRRTGPRRPLGGWRLAEPRYLAGLFVVVVLIVGGVAYAVTQGGEEADGRGNQSKQAGVLKPGDIEVTVLNGTAVPGLAATYGDKVERKGYT